VTVADKCLLAQSSAQLAVQKMFIGHPCTLSKTILFLGIDSISGLKWKEFGKIHTYFGPCQWLCTLSQ
jgi:hypothetical protein